MMAVKTAAGLAAHAKAQLGHYYWYGTFGQRPTLDLLNQKRKQYPNQMTAARYDYAKKNHVGKAGKRVFDCAGLVKSYWMMDDSDSNPKYSSKYDKSAAGLKSCCTTKGKISTIPEEPGLLVFIGTSHVGVYIGNGQVAEARGFDYGVVQTELKARSWDTWGRLDWLEDTAKASDTSLDAIARQVINGDWGNGEERKRRLAAAGHDYAAVQKRVNEFQKK